MNKKIWITILIILIILLVILASLFFIKLYKQEKYEEKITYTINKFEAFRNDKVSENDDEVSAFFNKIVLEENKQKNIQKNKILTSIDDIETTLEEVEKEITNYDIQYLEKINESNLNNIISNDVDRQTVLEIYQDNELVKNLEQEKNKRKDYLVYLDELKEDINYLIENKDNYYKKDDVYICKDKDTYISLNDIGVKYNLDIMIKQEKIKRTVPILCYHGVLDDAWGATTLFVKVDEFDKQMNYLKENGYTPIFISEIEDAGKYEKPVIITFDDGYIDVYTYAYPILQKYNFKSNFYIISDSIGGDVYVTQEMVKEMSDSGLVEIGSHTVSHPTLSSLDSTSIEYELKTSKETLEKITGKEVKSIAYPSGGYNQDVLDIVPKYYEYGISTDWGKEVSTNINRYNLKRLYVYREYNLEQFKGLL